MLETDKSESLISHIADDTSDGSPPSTPIKLRTSSLSTPLKSRKSVLQARTLIARMRLAQRHEIAEKKKELKKWAADAMRAEKVKADCNNGRLQQLAEARRKKAEISLRKKLFSGKI